MFYKDKTLYFLNEVYGSMVGAGFWVKFVVSNLPTLLVSRKMKKRVFDFCKKARKRILNKVELSHLSDFISFFVFACLPCLQLGNSMLNEKKVAN